MGFITMNEIRTIFKGKSANWMKGYYEGYNNPKQSLENHTNLMQSGRYENLSEKAKEYVNARGLGIEDRKTGDVK